jgi:Mn-containing catalase
MSDEDIYEELNSAGDARVKNNLKQAIGLAHADLDKEGASWSGPWRVAYVKVTGERVFDVGGGHHVGEHSLEAFGFRP